MREDIERALELIDALAESKDVIVIEVEVEHRQRYISESPETIIRTNTRFVGPVKAFISGYIDGHHGTPGSYVLFGVPKPKEKEDDMAEPERGG